MYIYTCFQTSVFNPRYFLDGVHGHDTVKKEKFLLQMQYT